MPATYFTLEEVAHKFDLKKRVLTQLIEAGMIEAHETPQGELLVVADKNGSNGQELGTKKEIIDANFAHLRGQKISASEASRKYSKKHGISIANELFSRWSRLGYIERESGYRLQLNEADVAYCAEVYAQKHKEYEGKLRGVRIFDEEGNPYQLKYPEVAEQLRAEREQARRTN
jgi:hypothetical protein